jgi:hypothetical protein
VAGPFLFGVHCLPGEVCRASLTARKLPTFKVVDGEHCRPVHVLVPRCFPQDAQPFQPSPQLRTGLAVLLRQREPEFVIGETQLEVAGYFRVREPAALQIPQRLRQSFPRAW